MSDSTALLFLVIVNSVCAIVFFFVSKVAIYETDANKVTKTTQSRNAYLEDLVSQYQRDLNRAEVRLVDGKYYKLIEISTFGTSTKQ